MSVVADIGMWNMEAAERALRAAGLTEDQALEVVDEGIDWCMAHDQNILFGICLGCGDDDSLGAYEQGALEWAREEGYQV